MSQPQRITVAIPQPLLVFLLDALAIKRTAAKNLLRFGAIAVNGTVVRQFDHPLVRGDEVTVGNPRAAAAASRLDHAGIQSVYEDDALFVVDKPSGLLTVATDREKRDTLFVRLNAYLKGRGPSRQTRVWVVHRLDQETSGLVLFAKSELVKQRLQEAWPTVKKFYLAVVEGGPTTDKGTISNYLTENRKSLKVFASDQPTPEARIAITHFRLLKTQDDRSLVEVRLETGRKHQIRVHLAGMGCPVVGDVRYGAISNASGRLALHACRLDLSHPITCEPLSLHSPLPSALRRLVS